MKVSVRQDVSRVQQRVTFPSPWGLKDCTLSLGISERGQEGEAVVRVCDKGLELY